MKEITTNVRMTREMRQILEDLAAKQGVPLSIVLRWALRDYIAANSVGAEDVK